jgi:uncharacterized membrane protein YhhN
VTAFLIFTLALVAAAGNWIAVHRENKSLEYLCKPLTMLILIGGALALDADDSTMQTWFVIALVLCVIGDVFLMLPQDLFVFGLASFLLGHIAYVIGMISGGIDVAPMGVGIVLVAIAIGVIGMTIMRAVRQGEAPELFGPVVAYMVVISTMVAVAFGTGHPAAIIGAALFYASDSLIAWNRFVRPIRNNQLAIMVTYHLAQFGLVLSLV